MYWQERTSFGGKSAMDRKERITDDGGTIGLDIQLDIQSQYHFKLYMNASILVSKPF